MTDSYEPPLETITPEMRERFYALVERDLGIPRRYWPGEPADKTVALRLAYEDAMERDDALYTAHVLGERVSELEDALKRIYLGSGVGIQSARAIARKALYGDD